jgi:uncharacterized protein YuzE
MVSVEFDPEANAIYIRIKRGEIEVSEPLSDDIIVDLDKNGEVLGIEVLLPKSDIVKRISLPIKT